MKDFFSNKKKLRGYREFLYILPFLILVLVFSYYPLYGWVYAFFDYKPPASLSWDKFVGLKWFKSMVENDVKLKQLLMVIRNTFAMSGISLLFSWFPMIFAIFLNEIKCRPFQKIVQTVTTLPNFISWVLVYSIAYCVFNSTGVVNTVGMKLGLIDSPVLFLQSGDHIWFKMWLWLTWKNAGWAAIMYLAAIAGIDEEMNEAAKVDGASRMQIIWNMLCFHTISVESCIGAVRLRRCREHIVIFRNIVKFHFWSELILRMVDVELQRMEHSCNRRYRGRLSFRKSKLQRGGSGGM